MQRDIPKFGDLKALTNILAIPIHSVISYILFGVLMLFWYHCRAYPYNQMLFQKRSRIHIGKSVAISSNNKK